MNHNPAAILDSGKSFSDLWLEELAAGNSTANVYSLLGVVKTRAGWYIPAS